MEGGKEEIIEREYEPNTHELRSDVRKKHGEIRGIMVRAGHRVGNLNKGRKKETLANR